MPPKVKSSASTNSTKGKQAKAPTGSGTSTPPVQADEKGTTTSGQRATRPDKAAYDAEQDKVKQQIDALQAKLNALQDKINTATGSGPKSERKAELRAEMDRIRSEQSQSKQSRGQIVDQLRALNDGIQKKVKDLQAAKGKTPFKTVAEIDAHIKHLEKQVESGNMKLADEKRALQEISQCKRTRRNVETFQGDQEAIERDRATADALRKQLDDPDWKATNERYDAIKAEMEGIRKEDDEAFANRNKLFDERTAIKTELDELYRQRRENSQRFKDGNDRYWAQVNEDRARRAERARAQREAEEASKKDEIVKRLREEAEIPAYQAQIEDCQTLIDYFSGKVTGAVSLKTGGAGAQPLAPSKSELAGVPRLELRQVDKEVGEGLVVRKKKGEEEENYFVAGKGKGKGKKGGAKVNTGNAKANGHADADADSASSPTTTTAAGSSQLQLPLATLTALLGMSIPPPSSTSEVAKTIEDLKTKKAWFEANQARVTAENVAKAEASIKKLLQGAKSDDAAHGSAEKMAEPASTPDEPAEQADEQAEKSPEAQPEVVETVA